MDDIPLKKPTSFEKQLNLIQQKGFHIEDKKECLVFLKKVSYYRLSAYFLPFLYYQSDHHFSAIPFEYIAQVYEFDQKLRALIFETIEEVEIFLRTRLSYYHAHKYGENGYTQPTTFRTYHDHQKFLNFLNNCISENKNAPAVKHHLHKYNGNFPIWVIIEYFSMGMLSYFYRDMNMIFETNALIIRAYIIGHFLPFQNSRLIYLIFPAESSFPNSLC